MLTQQAVLTADKAAGELLRRREAREHLIDFTSYTFPNYVAEPVHALIASELEACLRGDTRRLMIFTQPQLGKSELVSVRFPAFWLGKRPDDPVILTSYGAELAASKSRQARDLIESEAYRNLFGVQAALDGYAVGVRQDQRSVTQWRLASPHRGGMVAAGVGGAITGFGAALGIIDDPFENWEAAQSETNRQKVWEWYQSVFYTRIWEQGVIVIINTRWHEDDLCGRILAAQASGEIPLKDHYRVVRIPAIAETQTERDFLNQKMGLSGGMADPLGRRPGESSAPKRFSADYLERVRQNVGSLVWSSLYQGAPIAPGGNRFKEEFFRYVRALGVDKRARHVRYWDKAASENEQAAFTVGCLISAFPDGRFVISDVKRGQWSDLERERIILDTARQDAGRFGKYNIRIYIEQEPGSGGKDSVNATIRKLVGFNVYGDRVGGRGSKEVRWEPYAAQCEAGNVYLVEGLWNRTFIDEHLAAPNGKWLDQVDAAAGAFTFAAEWIQNSVNFSVQYA